MLRGLFEYRSDSELLIPEGPYGVFESFLKVEVRNPKTCGKGRKRYTLYEVRLMTNIPHFQLKESIVSRRYSDFWWLKKELEKLGTIEVPPLPGKAFIRQLPFRRDGGLLNETFVEERRKGLETFINKVAKDSKAQRLICVQEFLKVPIVDRI